MIVICLSLSVGKSPPNKTLEYLAHAMTHLFVGEILEHRVEAVHRIHTTTTIANRAELVI